MDFPTHGANYTPPAQNNKSRGARAGTLWRDLKTAVRGSQEDFTEGGLGRAILLLSVPMILEMVMESVFAVVDIFFVSKLGPGAVATVGVTESVLTIVYAIAIGFSMGATALVARRIGEKQPVDAALAAFQAICVGLTASIPIAAIGIFFAPELLGIMGMDPHRCFCDKLQRCCRSIVVNVAVC